MKDIDIIFISQSNVANYDEYSTLPLERIELFKELIYPRMVYFKDKFCSNLDVFNYFIYGKFYTEATPLERKTMLNIWNLPGFNGFHIADYLLQHQINTHIVNNYDTNFDELIKVYSHCDVKPIIAISTTFHLSFSEIRKISREIRKECPDAYIVLGGAFINERFINGEYSALEAAMRKNKINGIIHSFNSETDLKDLILSIKEKKSLNNVNNLFFFETNDFTNGILHKTSEKWNPPVLDSFQSKEITNLNTINNTLQIRSSSGCPFSCAFCSYPTTAGGFHVQKTETFEKSIENILSSSKINKLIFIDDTLNVPKTRFIEILKTLKQYKIEWFSFLRVQFIDEEIAKLMSESGCRAVYLGVESASDIVLENMNKKATKAQFLNGISYLKKYGIISMAAFIIGYPGETANTIDENVAFIENSGIEFYTLKEFYFMKNTPIFKDREKYGLTGIGSNWAHHTMTFQTASQIKSEMFCKIKGCIFIDPDTSLWLIAYLYDQGFSIEKIKLLLTNINQIMIEQINRNYSEDLDAFKNIKFALNN